GAVVCRCAGHTHRVSSVSYRHAGRLRARARNDGTARLWDLATGSPLRTFDQHVGRLWAAAFSPDASVLATAGDDLVVRLWDPASGAPLATLSGHTRRIWSLAFSPDGTRLASCGDDGTARLWDVSHAGETRLCVTLVAHDGGWAALAPDGGYKTGGDLAGEIWHVIGLCRFELGELDGHLDAVRRMPVDAPF
ncbi:MAG: WD40 repeat domain-containing protein, partial [Frankia sp.]